MTKNIEKENNFLNCDSVKEDCWKDGVIFAEKELVLIPFKWVSNFNEIYKFKCKIGSGRYGVVAEAIFKETNERCACKIVRRDEEYLRELDHLLSLSSIYGVLPIRRVSFTETKMCMEFELGNYTLSKAIKNQKYTGVFQIFDKIEKWIVPILISVMKIHKQRILHRDLKPDNIIMVERNGELIPELIDFGLSKRILGDLYMKDTIWYDIVTSCYRAPELWESKKVNNNKYRHYSVKQESWALGCILMEMFLKKPMFDYSTMNLIRLNISKHIIYHLGNDPFNITVLRQDTNRKKLNMKKFDIAKRLENGLLKTLLGIHINWNDPLLGTGGIVSNYVSLRKKNIFYRKFYLYEELLKGLLHPLPEKRLSVEDALNRIILKPYNLSLEPKLKFFYDCPLSRIIPRNEIVLEHKTSILKTIGILFELAKKNKPDPKSFFMGLYMWLSIIFDENIDWINHFHFRMILVCCYELIDEYHCSNEQENIANTLKSTIDFSEFYRYYKSSFCQNYLLTVKQGRIWIHNPSELRNLFFKEDKYTAKWDEKLDSKICDSIFLLLNETFQIPSPDNVIKNIIN